MPFAAARDEHFVLPTAVNLTMPQGYFPLPDGNFVMIEGEERPKREIRVMLNWFEVLKGDYRFELGM